MPDELLDAIRSGDVARLRALLEADPSRAGARAEQGLPAVLVALYHRQPEACQALLAAGPELGVLESAATGRLDVLRAHLAEDPGAVDARSPEGFTPLHLAAFFGGAGAVEALLAAGAPPDADAENPARVRPLHSAVAAGDREAARLLLAAGADPDARQQRGEAALLAAAHADDPELTRLLLEHGADRTLAAEDGRDAAAMAGERVTPLLA